MLVVDLRLIDDRVDRDGSLARGAVTNDKLALTSTDGNHRVDRHDARLHRLIDRFTWNNTRCDLIHWISFAGFDWALTVNRITNRVNHTAKKPHAYGHGK